MAKHPEQQERLAQEVHQVLGDRQPTQNDLAQLVFVEAVVKETLRLYPPVWQLVRDVVKDTRLGDYQCSVGQRLYLSLYHLQHNPDVFASPDDFQPERWLNADQHLRGSKGAFLSFGLGPRKCLGASFAMTELTLIVALIARRFQLTLVNVAQVQTSPDIVLRPQNLNMRIIERLY